MTKHHVVIVAPVHKWDDVRVFHKQANSLKRAGYKVTLMARVKNKKTINGISIVPAGNATRFRALRFFMLPKVAIKALRYKGDIYHLHNPDTIVVGLILWFFRKKIIYDTHEDFTERLKIRKWIPSFLRKPLIYMVRVGEKIISSLSDLSVATQADVLSRLRGKRLLIGNLPLLSTEQTALVDRITESRPAQDAISALHLRAIYIGSINSSRGLFEMLDALQEVNQSFSVRLWLAGQVDASDLRDASVHPSWQYVDFLDALPQPEAFAYVKLADVGLIVLRNEGGHDKIDPNKIYEYMRFGIPFIASNFSEWERKLGSVDAGFFITPSSNALAKCLIYCCENRYSLKDLGQRGSRFIYSNNWDKAFKALEAEYKRILKD